MDGFMLIQVGEGGAAAAGVTVPWWLPWGLVGLGVVVLGAVAVMLLRSRGAPGGMDATNSQRQAAGELAELKSQLVEVKKLAATVADDLDRRAARLERLIEQADEVLERSPDRDTDAETRGGSPHRRVNSQVAPPLAPVDDLAQRVFALADQGRTAVQIAQALRQPVGNVELMLALRGER